MNLTFSNNPGFNLKGQTKVRNSAIEIVLLVVVCALFSWFLIVPKRAEITVKKAELEQVEKEASEVAGKLATLDNLILTLKSGEKDVALLDQALPLEGKVLRMNFLIDALAKSVGVTLADLSVSSPSTLPLAGDKTLLADPYKAERKLQKMSGSVYVVGTFNQLVAFLKKVENSGRIIDILGISMDPASDGELNLKMTINAYYFGP